MKKIVDHLKDEWFKYALEIIVLIIGIYGAFELESWGENKTRKTTELEILKGCRTELEQDLKEIEANTRELDQSLRSLDIIITALVDDLPYHDSLAYHFNYTLLPMHFVHSTSTFEALKSKGFDIISNDSIRSQLITLYDSQYEFFIQGEIEELDNVFHTIKYLLPGRFEASWNYYGFTFEGEMIPLDFESLKTDTEYLFFIKTQRNRTKSYTGFFYANLRKAVEEMLVDLNAEISRLES